MMLIIISEISWTFRALRLFWVDGYNSTKIAKTDLTPQIPPERVVS